MAYSFLTTKNIFKRWEDSRRYTNELTTPFPEYQRIARNQPHPDIDSAYPKVTDGTSASIIQKTPKRVVQQLPTGVIETEDDNDWLPIVAQFIYTEKILPHANEDYGLFEKSHLVIENGLTFGSAASYAPFVNHSGTFTPDMTLPYWGDIFLQRGKKSGESCNYLFIRSWWQKADVESLIDSEKKLAAQAKKRGEQYESTWDTTALKSILDSATNKDQQATTPDEAELNTDLTAIEIVTGFQDGVGGSFYTFNPESKTIVRTKTNKDPRGKMPVDWFYGDIDGTNPLGRSIITLIGGLQNLIDSDMQAYQYNRALALQPPVVKYGNIGNFKFAPNVVIDASTDPNAKIVPLVIDTTALANYPQLYGLQKSQMLNLVSSPDTSISAEVGNPGFGKTPQALSQQKAAVSVDDNAVLKHFETWFGNWSETAINLYFGERSGLELLQLDKETAQKLRKLAEDGKFDITQLSDDDQIVINYDTATPALKFTVDASTSKMQDDQTQLAGLQLIQQFVDASPAMSQLLAQYPEKTIAIYNSLVALSGIQDPEKLSIDLEQYKKDQQAAQEASQAQAAQQPMQQQPMQQPQIDPAEAQALQQLRQLGFSDDVLNNALEMMGQGYGEQQVMQMLAGGGNG